MIIHDCLPVRAILGCYYNSVTTVNLMLLTLTVLVTTIDALQHFETG